MAPLTAKACQKWAKIWIWQPHINSGVGGVRRMCVRVRVREHLHASTPHRRNYVNWHSKNLPRPSEMNWTVVCDSCLRTEYQLDVDRRPNRHTWTSAAERALFLWISSCVSLVLFCPVQNLKDSACGYVTFTIRHNFSTLADKVVNGRHSEHLRPVLWLGYFLCNLCHTLIQMEM